MNLLFQQLRPSHMQLDRLAPGIFLMQTIVLYHHGQSFCSCQNAIIIEIHVLKPVLTVISPPAEKSDWNVLPMSKNKKMLICSSINIWPIALIFPRDVGDLTKSDWSLPSLSDKTQQKQKSFSMFCANTRKWRQEILESTGQMGSRVYVCLLVAKCSQINMFKAEL